jgi:drug/metabolite transporter superfamily protein YnfA
MKASFLRFVTWLRTKTDTVTARIAVVHFTAFAIISVLVVNGPGRDVFRFGGVFAWLIAGVALANVVFGVLTSRWFEAGRQISISLENTTVGPAFKARLIGRARDRLSWMEWADNAVLVLGFLGTLQGATIELTSIDPTLTGGAQLEMLRSVLRGVGVAIYTTLAGAGVALWTSVATKILSNNVESEAEVNDQ